MKRRMNLSSSSRLIAVLLAGGMLHGCASYNEAVESQKVVYKRAEKREVGLEVPPDLTTQAPDDQFSIPPEGGPSATVTASEYYSGNRSGVTNSRRPVSTEPVMVAPEDAQIRKVGSTRTILIERSAPVVYEQLRMFWKDNGFDLIQDSPEIGLMETNWLENRAAIPLDGVRSVIGRFFDGLYSSNMRDKYRTRVERIGPNTTEVVITHRGMEENYTDENETNLVWQPRPSDPELEAEMSNRFLAFLVGEQAGQVQTVQAEQPLQPKPTTVAAPVERQSQGGQQTRALVTVNKSAQGSTIDLAESFPRAWRRVGVSLDRAGFIVEDRDRAKGLFYVRYSPDSAANPDKKRSVLYDLFSFGDGEELEKETRYQVQVSAVERQLTSVIFLSEGGGAVKPKVSEQAADELSSVMGARVATVRSETYVKTQADQPIAADASFDQSTIATAPEGSKPLVSINKSSQGSSLNVGEGLPRAWQRVGYALGQAGFLVEDANQAAGRYFVRYAPSVQANPDKKRSVLLDLFDFGEPEELREEMRLQVDLSSTASNSVKVMFFNEEGKAVHPNVSNQAASLLAEQLR